MSSPAILPRRGWARPCPLCRQPILFATVWADPPRPFFYADSCAAVLMRTSDSARVRDQLEAGRLRDDESLLREWTSILLDAPAPPCGGRFDLWSSFRCPACRNEVPWPTGAGALHRRLWEPNVVILDGAIVVDDDARGSWRVRVIPEPEEHRRRARPHDCTW